MRLTRMIVLVLYLSCSLLAHARAGVTFTKPSPIAEASGSPDQNLVVRPELVLPTSQNISWQHAKIDDLTCPPLHPFPTGNYQSHQWSASVYSEAHNLQAPISGNLCHKLRYSVKCSENFFSSKTETKTISPIDISSRECQDAIEQKVDGSLTAPYFPARSCVWMKYNTVHLDFIIVEYKPVTENYYDTEFVDSIFVGGKCTSQICPTISGNVIWIGKREPSAGCPSPTSIRFTMYYENTECKFVDVPGYPLSRCEHLCRMDFCKQKVLIIDSGLGLTQVHTSKSTPVTIPKCATDRKIAVPSSSMAMDKEVLDLKEVDQREQCILELIDARSRNVVTRALLSMLSPVWPGVHDVYRINNGQLEMGRTTYAAATREETEALELNQAAGRIPKLSWTKAINGTSDGPNGMWRKDGKYYFPEMEILRSEYLDQLVVDHDLSPYDHPSARVISNHTEHFDTNSDEEEESGSIMEEVGGFFKSSIGSVVGAVIGLALLFTVLCVCAKMLACCTRSYKKRASHDRVRDWADSAPLTLVSSSRPTRATSQL